MQELRIVVQREVAEASINQWLDYKRIKPEKRDTYKDSIEKLILSMMYGELVLNEDFSLTHNLIFPLQGEVETKQVTYKPRMMSKDLDSRMKHIKADDIKGVMRAHAAALSGQPNALFGNMDTEDEDIWTAVVVFFL